MTYRQQQMRVFHELFRIMAMFLRWFLEIQRENQYCYLNMQRNERSKLSSDGTSVANLSTVSVALI